MGLGRGREAERIAHDDARFVLVRGGDGSVQAFAHFRFSANDEDYASRAVVYVWELQVAEPFQGAGLGRRVMGLLQLVAEAFQLDCVVLTVFKSNARALAFYMDKLGYAVDEDDPINFDNLHECYHILSRRPRDSTPRRSPRYHDTRQ